MQRTETDYICPVIISGPLAVTCFYRACVYRWGPLGCRGLRKAALHCGVSSFSWLASHGKNEVTWPNNCVAFKATYREVIWALDRLFRKRRRPQHPAVVPAHLPQVVLPLLAQVAVCSAGPCWLVLLSRTAQATPAFQEYGAVLICSSTFSNLLGVYLKDICLSGTHFFLCGLLTCFFTLGEFFYLLIANLVTISA